MAEQILFEFTADTTGLQPAVDQLEALGAIDKQIAAQFKATNTEIKKQESAAKAAAAAVTNGAKQEKKAIDDLDKAVKNLTQDFVQGFEEGVVEALKDAGVSAEQFSEALKNGGTEVEKVTTSVRTRLREIVQELALMRSRGEEATDPERYAALTREAGNLRDSLADVNEEINRAGSDTGGFDSLIQVAQGVAGGFAVAQGAAALFGDESEELQEVLLRVNAAMAVLQGLQQLQAVYAARIAVARGLETAATTVQTIAQTAYNFVVGTSIGLMKAFRIALAATGIGLFVIALIELVSYLSQTAEDLRVVNRELERNKNIVEADTAAIKDLTDEFVVFAESRNALESQLISIRGRALQQERQVLAEANERLAQQQSLVDGTSEAWFLLNKQIEENNTSIRAIDRQTIQAGIQLEKQLAKERLESIVATTERALDLAAEGSAAQLALQKKLVQDKLALDLGTQALTEAQRLQLITAANKQQLELQADYNRRLLEGEIGAIENRLSTVVQGTNAELQLRKELLAKQAAAELTSTKLSAAERLAILRDSANEQAKLDAEFAAQEAARARENREIVRRDIIQAAITRNATELALLKDNDEERLRLQLVSIELAASEERRQAEGNALEIARITAQAEEQKLAIRRQFADQAFDYEQRLEAARNGRNVRAQQAILSSDRSTFQQRVDAIIELGSIDKEAVDKRKDNLRDLYKQGLISQKDYTVQYAELEDQRLAISEETERQILEATRARTRAQIQTSIEVAGQLVGLLDNLFADQSEREKARIEEQKTRVDELRESGAITEKEAARRRKQLEIEERQAQQRAAQRDKQIAVFRAVLAIPTAFLQGLGQGGPILGAIYAAIAAAQAAIVIARPIPKFGKGKKNAYQGPAEIGETGPELMESNGKMYLAKRSTFVWMGSKDKVYNPQETAAMLEKRHLKARSIPAPVLAGQQGSVMDYEKLGDVIARKSQAVNLNIDGYKQFIINGHQFITQLNSRRGY